MNPLDPEFLGKTTLPSGLPVTPAHWVDQYGDDLHRYALARLGQPEVAEDVVQDTLLAAIKGIGRFDRRSSEKTWLLSILKRKIADHFREHFREEKFLDEELRIKDFEEQFDENGWRNPAARSNKEKFAVDALDRDLFWRMVQECLCGVPRKFADVFFLRTIEQVSTQELCESLRISSNNLRVILHRVRSALRLCLENRWFKREKVK